jgi:hypothetical protein
MNKLVRYTIIFCVALVMAPSVVFAQSAAPTDINSALNSFTQPTGIAQDSLTEAAGNGLEIVFALTGFLFFIMALYGGIRWMTSQGEEATVKKGRDTLVGATIGLVVVVASYGISQFITSRTVASLSSSGTGPALQEGAGDSADPNFTPTETAIGCCVYKVSRTNSNFAWVQTDSADACEQASEASGVDSDRGEEWQWYTNIPSAETCNSAGQCWSRTLDRRQTACLTELGL